jgi:hypothetical protein
VFFSRFATFSKLHSSHGDVASSVLCSIFCHFRVLIEYFTIRVVGASYRHHCKNLITELHLTVHSRTLSVQSPSNDQNNQSCKKNWSAGNNDES